MLRRVARVVLNGVAALLGLLVVALAGAQLALQSAWGREQLRVLVNHAVSDALDAHFEIARLDAAGLWYVRGSGLALVRGPEQIASVERFAIHFNLLALFAGRIEVTGALLDRPYVELGAPFAADDRSSGLFGLLRSGADDAAPSSSQPSSFTLVLHRLRITGGRVYGTWTDARFGLVDFGVGGSMELGSQLRAHVGWLAVNVSRNEMAVAAVHGSDLGYGATGALSGKLRVQMRTSELAAKFALGAPGLAGARRVSGMLAARGVSPESLSQLGVDADWLRSAIDLDVAASGTTRDGSLDVAIGTEGGDVQLQAHMSQGEQIRASLRTARLDTRRVLSSGFDPIAAEVAIRANVARDFGAVHAELELNDGRYAEQALPHVQLGGSWTRAAGFELDRLLARYSEDAELLAHGFLRPDGQLEAHASAHVAALARVPLLRELVPGLSGSMKLEASARRSAQQTLETTLELSASSPALGNASARTLQLQASAQGEDLDTLRADATLRASELHVARTELTRTRLQFHVDPRCYIARGDFGAQGQLYIRADRVGEDLRAVGNADVDLGHAQRLTLDLGSVRYERGKLTLARTRLAVGKASARVDGWLQPRGQVQLTAAVRVPDLRQVSQLVLEQPLEGRIELDARVSGELRRPLAKLAARYRTPTVLGLHDADLSLDLRADAPKRRIELEVTASARHVSLKLAWASTLPSAEISQEALERAEHELTLEIDRFALEELSVFPSARLRLTAADLRGRVTLKGTLRAPEASAELVTRAQFLGDRTPMTLTVSADYARTKLAVDLKADDGDGTLFHSRIKTDLDGEHLVLRSAEDFSSLLTKRAWEAELTLHARRIDQLPAVHAVPVEPALFPWRFSAHVRFEHQPGEEPRGELALNALFAPARERENAPRCGTSGAPKLALVGHMRDGTLETETHLRVASTDMLALKTHSRAPIDQWLGPVSPQPVDLVANLDHLRFASLPALCEQLDGELSGRIALSRAITQKVELSASLRGDKIAWNHAPAFDAWLEAHADRDDVVAKLDMKAATGAATLTAHLPLDASARIPMPRRDAPLKIEARLQEMSVPALLGGVPGISADAGAVNGVIQVSGSLQKPSFHGGLALRKVSMTLGKIGQRFEDVTGKITFDGTTLHLAKTVVHDRDGQLELSGDLALESLERMRAKFEAKAKGFPIRREGVVLGSIDGELRLVAQIDPQRTTLDLALRKAAIELNQEDFGPVQTLKPNREVYFTDVRAGDPAPENEDTSETVLHIDASDPFWVRREDFGVLIGTQMTIVSRGDQPEITGTLEIQRGTIELIGQIFDIDRGRIEFSGGHDVEPNLDLVAKRQMPGGGTVGVQAQGPLHEPTLTFTIDDKAVPAEEALAALSGGGSAGSASMQNQLSSVATGMAAGVLTLGARRQLGDWVPVLAVESGTNETRVRAGVEARRLIPKFLRKLVVDAYVEGMVSSVQDANETDSEAQSSAQTQAAVLLELRFPHSLVGEAQYGPGQRWSTDLSWEP